jgi:hypothetical protein
MAEGAGRVEGAARRTGEVTAGAPRLTVEAAGGRATGTARRTPPVAAGRADEPAAGRTPPVAAGRAALARGRVALVWGRVALVAGRGRGWATWRVVVGALSTVEVLDPVARPASESTSLAVAF